MLITIATVGQYDDNKTWDQQLPAVKTYLTGVINSLNPNSPLSVDEWNRPLVLYDDANGIRLTCTRIYRNAGYDRSIKECIYDISPH
jgi:Ni,Fe-hydrogenase I small subunit